jgi:hypothetical protein
MDLARRLIPMAAMGPVVALGSLWAVTGTIAAIPNPCEIASGAHDCTTYGRWSTKGARHARVYVKAEGQGGAREKEFGTGPACAKCGANWIEAGARYTFTLVDFSSGTRGAELASVTVTAVSRGGGAVAGGSGAIAAVPNPCRIAAGKAECATNLTWSTEGIGQARVYVTAEGVTPFAEREFRTGCACEKCGANWIRAGTRYLFALYDFSTGSRGRALASVVVTAIK